MDSKLFALFGHWCNADAIRIFAFSDIPKQESSSGLSDELSELANRSSSYSRISVWYSLLYVVIEGYVELKLKNPDIDGLLKNEEFVDYLRIFRNATFHYQKDPLTEKARKFIDARESEIWIRSLNKAFDAFFLAELPIKKQMNAIIDNS